MKDEDNLIVTFGVATEGQVVVTGGSSDRNLSGVSYAAIAEGDANDNSLFLDESDDVMKVKDNSGTVTLLQPSTAKAPVGSVVSWLKDYTNTPTLSDEWVECNGQTLVDAESVYDGQVIPDLNGDAVTLHGSTTSGTVGDTEHDHGDGSYRTVNDDTNQGQSATVVGTSGVSYSGTLINTHSVVWIIRIK